jgi:hypothetical protein
MQKIILLFLIPLLAGCVFQNELVQPFNSANPTATANPVTTPSAANVSPTSSAPVPTASPSGQVSPTPAATATPTPVPTPTGTPFRENNFLLGIANSFEKITNETTDDAPKETTETVDDLVKLGITTVIIDFKQKIIDPDLDGEKLTFGTYDRILNGLAEKGIHAILRVPHDRVFYGSNSVSTTNGAITTPVKNFLKYLEESAKHYKEYDISWLFGERINDTSFLPGTQQDYIDFLSNSADTVKRISPDRKIYLGSILQSEVFGEKPYFAAENLLSYLNMGAAKYVDGFIFEVYSLAYNDDKDYNSQANYIGTDYKLVEKYYNSFTDILKQKNLTDKKIFLVTGTYTNTILNELTLTEEQQANDIARRLVYAISTGYDQVFIPELIDKKYAETQDFFQEVGLILKNSQSTYRKLSFFTVQFIAGLLQGTEYKGKVETLPKSMEGFIFTKDKSQFYVIWNNDENFKDVISPPVKGKKVILHIAPSDTNKTGINLEIFPDSDGKYNISFNSNPQNVRILEVTE